MVVAGWKEGEEKVGEMVMALKMTVVDERMEKKKGNHGGEQ